MLPNVMIKSSIKLFLNHKWSSLMRYPLAKNGPMSPVPYVSAKNTSAIKSLHLFTKVYYVKQKTAVCRLGAV